MDSPIHKVQILEGKKRVAVLEDHGVFSCFNFAGNEIFKTRVSPGYTDFEIRSDGFYFWTWNSHVIHLNHSGKVLDKIRLPTPLRRLKVIPKTGEFFVIHDPVSIVVYDSKGDELWRFDNPSPIETGKKRTSEVSVSYSGNAVAVCCFSDGIYTYDARDVSLVHHDLEKVVTRVSVSQDGRLLLFSDAFHNLYLASRDGEILWETSLTSEILGCRLDQRGTHALVLEKTGALGCVEFLTGQKKRSHFLEMKDNKSRLDKKELWKQPCLIPEETSSGILKISSNGQYFLFGERKGFRLYDAGGALLWDKSFMSVFDQTWISHDGRRLFFANSEEVRILDIETRHEKPLVFFESGLKEIAVDPRGLAVMTLENRGTISLFSGEGEELWKRTLKQSLNGMQINHKGDWAVLETSSQALYTLTLKNLKRKKLEFGEPYSCVKITDRALFVGGEKGAVYAVDRNGSLQWQKQTGEAVRDIFPMKGSVLVIGDRGAFHLFDDGGAVTGKGLTKSPGSFFNDTGKEILEIARDKESVSFYNLLTGELLWKLHTGSIIRSIAVSEATSRMVALDSNHLTYYHLGERTGASEERASYLEF